MKTSGNAYCAFGHLFLLYMFDYIDTLFLILDTYGVDGHALKKKDLYLSFEFITHGSTYRRFL